MSESLKESLSALLDNEADQLELRRVLKAVQQDPELLATWQRYSTVQALLRDGAMPLSDDFAARVARAIDAERPPRSAGLAPWQQNLAKLAIAASVAAVFFVALQVGLTPAGDNTPQLVDATAAAPVELAPTLVADVPDEVDMQWMSDMLRSFIESVNIDIDEPPITEHLQDSPLYRLVNELEDQ
ncbi:MAG: sigma-E factor negative regulatory protein [Gammaproteobacteria bacterium]